MSEMQLRPIEHGAATNARAHVIFIHGLGGHYWNTWVSRHTTFCWPLELARARPDVLVWTLQYSATPTDWIGNAVALTDRAVQFLHVLCGLEPPHLPLVFVTHSLGGLLFKQSLRLSVDSTTAFPLARHTRGVAFFATPHTGSAMAAQARRRAFLRPSVHLGELAAHDPHLRDLNRWFRNVFASLNISARVFVETRPVTALGRAHVMLRSLPLVPLGALLEFFVGPDPLVVGPAFADPGIPGIDAVPIDGDHFHIVKPESRRSFAFQSVTSLINDVLPLPEASPSVSLEAAGTSISLGRLPTPADPDVFVGRTAEVDALTTYLRDPSVEVVQIVADGGVGKSTTVWHWLNYLRELGYGGVGSAFDWSFYSQGKREYEGDSHLFLRSAAAHFSDTSASFPAFGPTLGPEELGEAVARAHLSRGGLLVLDGMEPLQHYPSILSGSLRDVGLSAFFRVIRSAPRPTPDAASARLVVVTTRWRVPQLDGRPVRTMDLTTLNDEHGAELLARFSLPGLPYRLTLPFAASDHVANELRRVSREVNGHALALILLASFLLRFHHGDIGKRPPRLMQSTLTREDEPYRHARRILRSYDALLADSSDILLHRARQLLMVLGLFDQPAKLDVVRELLRSGPIACLTDSLDDTTLGTAVEELQRLRLVTLDSADAPDRIETHPLVREHFGEVAESTSPDGWRLAHERVYRHLSKCASELPSTALGLQPLFDAAAHACRAGIYTEAFREIYRRRIMREQRSFAGVELGLASPVVTLLSHFFAPEDWSRLVATEGNYGLSPEDCLQLFLEAGTYLTAVRGYSTHEVRSVYLQAMNCARELGKDREFAIALHGLWRFDLVRGEFSHTTAHAEQLAHFSHNSADPLVHMLHKRVECTTKYYKGEFSLSLQGATTALEDYSVAAFATELPHLAAELTVMLKAMAALSSWHLADSVSARSLASSCLADAERLDRTHTLVIALLFNVWLNQFRGAFGEAHQFAGRMWSLAENKGLGAMMFLAAAMYSYSTFMQTPDYDEIDRFRQAVDRWQDTGAGLLLPYCLDGIGRCYTVMGDAQKATPFFLNAVDVARSRGELWWLPTILCSVGFNHAHLGDGAAATSAFEECLAVLRLLPAPGQVKRLLRELRWHRERCSDSALAYLDDNLSALLGPRTQ